MKGSLALFDESVGSGMAALLVDGRMVDLMVDPPLNNPTPRPEAIYRGILERPLKGMHGAMLKLPNGQTAFLKEAKGLAPGAPVIVQVSTFADGGKAAPVGRKLIFKSRYAIVTPANPGFNIARSIREDDERDRLLGVLNAVSGDGTEGIILRSACEGTDEDTIAEDIENMLHMCRSVLSAADGKVPELLLDAPAAAIRAWRDWDAPDQVEERAGCFADHGVLDYMDAALEDRIDLGDSAWISIEPTRALIAIDVNTGGDFSPSAGIKTNLKAAKEISRQLLLRGLGGQITIDFAPMPKRERLKLENTLKAAFRKDGVDTILAGWTPLGNMELQRKRERLPLQEAIK